MGFILVIEKNESILDEIKDAISQIDPKLTVVSFPESADLLKWMQQLQNHEPNIVPPLPNDRFHGLITEIESWKFKDTKLIGKFKALFVQKCFAENEENIFVLFTGYETPKFEKKRFEYRSVNNFIFKPFDKVMLKQTIDIALNGRQPIKNHFTHVHKSETKIEMLKEIRLTGVSELGFESASDQAIQVGTIAKYYADFLETDQHRSALAKVISFSKPEGKEFANVALKFFALDQTQSFNLQKLTQAEKKTRAIEGTPGPAEAYEFYFVSPENGSLCQEVVPSVERFFDHPVTQYKGLVPFSEAIKADTRSVHARFVFIDHALIVGNEAAEIDALHSVHQNKNLVIFVLSPRVFPEQIELELSSCCEDIFYAPFNRSYIIKGLKQQWSDLRNKEDIFERVHPMEQLIHVSNPVKIVEVSEAGVVIAYHRELPIGSFREFVFWMSNEAEVPTLLGQCNFTEPSSDKKSFHCHFIFFGMHDLELKFIRRWMLNEYVEEKQKEG